MYSDGRPQEPRALDHHTLEQNVVTLEGFRTQKSKEHQNISYTGFVYYPLKRDVTPFGKVNLPSTGLFYPGEVKVATVQFNPFGTH